MNYFSIEKRCNESTVRRTGLWDFIEWWPSAHRSTAQIKNAKGYPLDLISTVDQGVNGSRQLRPVTSAARCTERRRHGPYSGEAAWGYDKHFSMKSSPAEVVWDGELT
jgi:hypothetical protein